MAPQVLKAGATDNGLRTNEMPWIAQHLLSIAVFLPLAGAVAIAFLGRERAPQIRWVALAASLLTFLVTLFLYFGLEADTPGMQFVETHNWITSPAIDYHLGVDGLSGLLILLTGFLTPFCVLVSWTSITQRVKEFFIFLLALETGMIGVFASLDYAVLRFLGSHVDPHVFPDRHLGSRAAGLCGSEVHAVHHGRAPP